MLKKTLIASLLAGACISAFALDYYVVVPLPGKQAILNNISVELGSTPLPAGVVGMPYEGFNLSSALQVRGDPAYSASQVSWSVVAGALPVGLVLNNGIISGTPTAAGEQPFSVHAAYKTKTGEQVYTIVVKGVALQITSISSGLQYTCAVTAAGGVKCWGANDSGQLGDGTTVGKSTPVDVVGLTTGVTGISVGDSNACAVTAAGGVKCWGNNSYGQLGDGTTVAKSTPGNVVGLTSGVASISVGTYQTCALTAAGSVKCWGSNYAGQLGDGTTVAKLTPGAVVGLTSGVVSISVGGGHTCALTTAGGVQCLGDNSRGQLGDGTTVNRGTPGNVDGLTSGMASISAGESHTCALTNAGSVRCWGSSSQGQLGDGTTVDKSTQVEVIGLTAGVVSISGGRYFSCAVATGGGAKCWGSNSTGELGDGTTAAKSTPVAVAGLASGAASISAGANHTCAVTSAGGAKCWGQNNRGQLGDNTTVAKSTPVVVLP